MKNRSHITHRDVIPPGVILYTKPQMAAALQVSVRCLEEMMHRGDICYLKIHGRIVRFHPDEALRRLSETSLENRAAIKAEDGNRHLTRTPHSPHPQPLSPSDAERVAPVQAERVKTEDGRPRTEVRNQRSEVRSQKGDRP
jgi:hypothetical protein